MRRRALIIAGVLEIYVIVLAQWQALGGVRTDEAKYLLSIPYPHPPLLRTLLSLTDALPFQEMLWRFLIASALVQAVCLVWDMGKNLSEDKRMALAGAWLLSTGLILQGGSVMLAPVTALFGVVILWLLQRPAVVARYAGLVALLWLAALFSAYQAFLYAPLVWLLFRRGKISWHTTALFVLAPILLLLLYTLTNPLTLATIAIHSSEGARVSGAAGYADRIAGVVRLWIMAGGLMVGTVGTWGILSSRNASLVASFALVVVYCTLSIPYPFYAILFTPLFVEGVRSVLIKSKRWETFPLLVSFAAGAAVVTLLFRLPTTPGPARAVMQAIRSQGKTGDVMIAGSFGHDWEYESWVPVRHYVPALQSEAQAIVCLSRCDGLDDRMWKRLSGVMEEVWIKR